jgi:hypothetical protein
MKKSSVYILIYNSNVQYASKDVKSLHGAMDVMCNALPVERPLSYVQVTRILNEKSFYIHTPAFGHQWQVVERELLYTKRKKRPPVQRAEIADENLNKSMSVKIIHSQIQNKS